MGDHKPFCQGNHICVVYRTPEEQFTVAAHFVAEGLTQGEQCLYAANDAKALSRFRTALRASGVDVPAAEAREALLLRTTDQAHLVNGYFDAERMLSMLNDLMESALNKRFTGLRTCGDMSWLLEDAPGSEQVIEYEGLLNQFFANARALGMCLYDESRLPERLLDRSLAAHTSVVVDRRHTSNPFYRPWPFAPEEPVYAAASKLRET